MSCQTSPTKYSAQLAPTTMQDKEQIEALTGRILHTDANASDFIQQTKRAQLKECLSKPTVWQLAAVVALLALLGTVIGLAVSLSQRNSSTVIDPACIHALGGGPVKLGGGLDMYSTAPAYCQEQLHAYADSRRGSYWREVEISMVAAMAGFGFAGLKGMPQLASTQQQQQDTSHSPGLATQAELQQQYDGSVASRLSRSLLAAVPSSSSTGQGPMIRLGGPVAGAAVRPVGGQLLQVPQPGPGKVVVFDIDETVLSNMPQILDPNTWPWDKWVAAAQAPALKPTLQFYRALCDAGYNVAFVTGRKETARNSTMHNLEMEGYGKPCKDGPGPYYGARPLRSSSGSTECCYSALYLRQKNDTSLASVYKPGARKDLLQKGNMTLAALVGDQFSDLNGEVSAPYAFKLPNPFYYIL